MAWVLVSSLSAGVGEAARPAASGANGPAANGHHHQFESTSITKPINAPTVGRVLQEALAHLDEVDVEHHHHEHKQDTATAPT